MGRAVGRAVGLRWVSGSFAATGPPTGIQPVATTPATRRGRSRPVRFPGTSIVAITGATPPRRPPVVPTLSPRPAPKVTTASATTAASMLQRLAGAQGRDQPRTRTYTLVGFPLGILQVPREAPRLRLERRNPLVVAPQPCPRCAKRSRLRRWFRQDGHLFLVLLEPGLKKKSQFFSPCPSETRP